ncbi:hypothetical protein GCM10009811_30440 [Nostocoides veronense]|uniref:Uncharacterized protein n=2 Tax=Nostocoides veronense TaxID=330836 RepID=A0ABP4YAH8_9MICO
MGMPTAPAPAAASDPVADRLIVVGTGGFTWAQVSQEATPALWELLAAGSSTTNSVRSVNPNTCPVDGWLSLSAGQRAAAPSADGAALRPTSAPCPAIPQPTDNGAITVPEWATYVAAAHSLRFDAEPGLLGTQLDTAGVSRAAIGPGAAIAAADTQGRVPAYAVVDWTSASQFEMRKAMGEARVVFVDVGSVRDPADLAAGEARPEADVAAQLAEISRRVGLVERARASDETLILAGLSDAGVGSRLRPIVVRGPDYGPGELYSPSTRQPGLAQSQDLTVTILRLVEAQVPAGMGGALLAPRNPGSTSAEAVAQRQVHLNDVDDASHEIHPLVPIFFYGLILAQLLIYLLTWRVWARERGSVAQRLRLVSIVRVVGVVAASVPAATFLANLIPWWRSAHPLPAIVGSVALFVALIAGAALLPPWGRTLMGPVAVVGGATMLVLAVDVMTGSRLQQSSLMGLQPVVGGRFYGMGNVTFSIFATASLMLAIALAHCANRRWGRGAALAAVLVIGLATVVIDGSPAWGADGGGPPAYLPGLAFFVLALLGIRMTVRRAAVIAAVTAGLFLLVGFLDSLRPAQDQSHLGRFFDTIGSGGALDIIIRKAQQNWGILISSPLTVLVPFGLFFVIFVLLRPTSWGSRSLHRSFERVPYLRPGLIAWLVVMTIGFFINDSGVAIPAVGATVAIPLIVAISSRTLVEEAAHGAN